MKYFKAVIIRFLTFIYPEWQYWRKAKKYYLQQTGKRLRYTHPCDLNEKLMWLTRYWRHPLKTVCADKYKVRTYLSSLGLDFLSVPLLGVYNKAEEINFNQLPSSFVLKCNHGSGFNVVILDKSQINNEEIKTRLSYWMKQDFSEKFCELHYKDIDRKIICEQLLSNTAPMEYQFWCINGFPESILACRKNYDGTYDSWSYSTDWNRLYDRIGEEYQSTGLNRPKKLSNMIEYAKLLSKPFPFVRVDFYETDNTIYFAELTFTPCANILSKYKYSFIERLGKQLVLPKPYLP